MADGKRTVKKKAGEWRLPRTTIAAIVAGTERDPYAVLGVHSAGSSLIARCFIPGADAGRQASGNA
jgi:hypothetical protein